MKFIILLLLFNGIYGYYVVESVSNQTSNGTYIYDLRNDDPNQFQNATLEIRQESQNQVDIRIIDKGRKQYQIPNNTEPFKSLYRDVETPVSSDKYDYQIKVERDPLDVKVIRGNETIFNPSDIRFSELYLEVTIPVCTQYFFGLGERNQKGFRFRNGCTADFREWISASNFNNQYYYIYKGKNVYSSQPVYLMKEKSGKYHVLFYKSSSYMDVIYQNDKLTFKSIGGVFHFKLFLGDFNPQTAIKLYHNYLGGGWALQPFWSMGFHQSRWPMRTSQRLIQVIKTYHANDLPIDTIWSDLDYMFDRQIFSVDHFRFQKDDYEYIQNDLNCNYVVLIDVAVGVKYGDIDKGYSEGIKHDLFLRSPTTGKRFMGYVWPGDAYFPDFFHPNITNYWPQMTEHLFKQTNFSGIWIDMNEPTNFCTGECQWERTVTDDYIDPNAIHPEIQLPYTPGETDLGTMTLRKLFYFFQLASSYQPQTLRRSIAQRCPQFVRIYGRLLYSRGFNHRISFRFQLGLKEIREETDFLTYSIDFCRLRQVQSALVWRQCFHLEFLVYISRITFLIQCKSLFFSYHNKIGKIFGIPMSGADVCGFLQDTTSKLCARWIQLGALYPFFRNHNNDQAMDQEFYALGKTVLTAAQRNVHLRYSILKHYYSIFIKQNSTGTVVHPLFFEFLDDEKVFQDYVLDTQLMIGQELMAAPILEQFKIVRQAYFPQSTWYSLVTGLLMQKQQEQGRTHLLFCRYDDYVPIYIRGGHIIFQQETTGVLNIKGLTNHFNPVIALQTEYVDDKSLLLAQGSFIDIADYSNDQEIIESCQERNCVLNVTFSRNEVGNQYILEILRAEDQKTANKEIFIDSLKILGLNSKNSAITCKIGCLTEQFNYKYNTIVQFDKPVQIGGQNGSSRITIDI